MQKPDVKGFFDQATATWTYVVWNEESEDKNCAVIDSVLDYDIFSGRTNTSSVDLVISFIKEKGLNLQWILETHIHADHLTAASYIKEKLGGKTAISKHIIEVLKTWQPIFQNESDTPLNGEQFDYLFEDNEKFNIGSLESYIIHTPGHTPADTSYVIGDAVFVGDAMFLPDVGSGRCDFPGGNAENSYKSCQKILSFPDSQRIYVGHDYPPSGNRGPQSATTVLEQKETNIRLHKGISESDFISKRKSDDIGKPVPKLLFPSLQVNLRAGKFGKDVHGIHYMKIPINKV